MKWVNRLLFFLFFVGCNAQDEPKGIFIRNACSEPVSFSIFLKVNSYKKIGSQPHNWGSICTEKCVDTFTNIPQGATIFIGEDQLKPKIFLQQGDSLLSNEVNQVDIRILNDMQARAILKSANAYEIVPDLSQKEGINTLGKKKGGLVLKALFKKLDK